MKQIFCEKELSRQDFGYEYEKKLQCQLKHIRKLYENQNKKK